ncbi:MAG TPA: ATP-binding protein [Gemmatimonadales bacterium]|jgi:serine/threonine-protein kinase RsbW
MAALARVLPHAAGDGDRFRIELPSDLARVGDVVDAACACCFGDGLASRRTRFRLCTVLAEAVANAMLYGNHGDPALVVTIDIAIRDHEVILSISDQGDGFDHTAIPLPIGDESVEATRGRGLYMIHRLAEHVAFNERGNTIWITLPRH